MTVDVEALSDTPVPGVVRVVGGSFAAFYAEQWSDVAGFCSALVGSRTIGDDLAQEAFTRVCTRWLLIREPRPYVFRVARNLAYRHLRHASGEVLVDTTPESAPPPRDQYEVMASVQSLPERLRGVVLLHYYADLPVAEVATVLRRPLGSVKRQLSEARLLLSRSLGGDHV